jgi:hypothetical protein
MEELDHPTRLKGALEHRIESLVFRWVDDFCATLLADRTTLTPFAQ